VSEANVDIVRAIHEAWDRGESVRDLVAEDLEYVNPPYAVEAGTRHDRRALDGVLDVYPDFRVEPERFVDAGEHVVVVGTVRGTAASGVQIQLRQGYVWTIRDGKAIRFRWFNDPAEALEAAGVSP
jgi:ketosteroid isomerase-like protein